MNATEQTSDPTLWRYPSLWSPNRRIHIDNLESTLTHYEYALKEARERLEGILQVCEFIDDEDQHQTKATEATLATINKVLGDK